VAAKRNTTEDFRNICVVNGEWEVCDNGKATDGYGVQTIQQRKK
jgi:hypothetical protein